MHRREGDYNNAKHWFRKVGEHPVFPKLRKRALRVGGETIESPPHQQQYSDAIETAEEWDPFQFVDWCADAETKNMDPAIEYFLKKTQLVEIRLLLEFSCEKAIGG